MNIQVAVLCDAATDDTNQKLNILGAFDTIYAMQFPAVHPQCSVALRVTFGAEDEGAHRLKVNFVDADGRSIVQPIEIPVQVGLPEDAHFWTRNFILNMQQMSFKGAGLYSVEVGFDDVVRGNIPLLIKQIATPPGWPVAPAV